MNKAGRASGEQASARPLRDPQLSAQRQPARLYTRRETARVLCISERLLWELTNRGELAHVRIGRAVRYDAEDVRAWIEARKQGGRPR